MKQRDIATKLAVNRYQSDPQNPHIKLAVQPDPAHIHILLLVCPAGLYQLNSAGELQFDHLGCLECGACTILDNELPPKPLLQHWSYPADGLGVEYRQG